MSKTDRDVYARNCDGDQWRIRRRKLDRRTDRANHGQKHGSNSPELALQDHPQAVELLMSSAPCRRRGARNTDKEQIERDDLGIEDADPADATS
jgi:hypothetical protein